MNSRIGYSKARMICLANNTFIRHVDDESIIWCPRSDGCTVMRNARPILEEIVHKKRSVGEIVYNVANKLNSTADEIAEDVVLIVEELSKQHFIRIEDSNTWIHDNREEQADSSSVSKGNMAEELLYTPLEDFYSRHRLPNELHIDLTDGCNEKCVHCYLPKGGAHYLDKDIAFKVLKEFREAQGLTVYVSGGECMLHRNFAEILRYAKSLDLNIVVMSNLICCDEKIATLLKEIDPQFVNVSLYAVTEDIHDSITQIPGSCCKTKEAIDALQAVGVHVRIATPFMHENRTCVDELKEYASRHQVHLIGDCEIFGQIDHSCGNQSHALSMKEMEMIISAHKDVFVKVPMDPLRCEREAKVCDIGDARLNLDAQGMYYPCDGFHGAIIGDARKDSLWDVWTGNALNKLRGLMNKDFGTCASCADRAWCKVCPMRNFNETGNMFTHVPWRCRAARIYRRIYEEEQSC